MTGILPQALLTKEKKLKQFFLPEDNKHEAAIVENIDLYPVDSLLSLFLHLSNQKLLVKQQSYDFSDEATHHFDYDMQDIKGQQQTKRAMDIAHAYS